MPKTADNLYQSYEKFRQGLTWKEGTTDEEKMRALAVLQQFVKFLVDNEWRSGVSSRRDQFAMAALQGLLANEDLSKKIDLLEVSGDAFAIADYMIIDAEK